MCTLGGPSHGARASSAGRQHPLQYAPAARRPSLAAGALADFEAEERRRAEAEADARAKARGRDEHNAPAAPQTPAAAQLGAAGKAGAARGADEKAADAVLEGLGAAQQATPAAAASSGAGAGAGPSPEEFAKNISALLKELSLADKADGKQDEVKVRQLVAPGQTHAVGRTDIHAHATHTRTLSVS